MRSSLVNVLPWGESKESPCALVVIQGLGGRIHAPIQEDTQGVQTIQKLIAEFPDLQVYGIDYPSQLEDFKSEPTLNSQRIIQELTDAFHQRLWQRHEHLICIGYCLGGYYLSKMLPRLEWDASCAEEISRHPFNRLSLLFLDAPYTITPEGLTPWFQGILDILEIDPAELKENEMFWKESRIKHPEYQLWGRTSAIVSSKESWVTPLGPNIGLPEFRIQVVSEEHNDLMSLPKQENGQVYKAIKSFVMKQVGKF